MPLNSTRRDGFSLLELSIVLVILGLLTAGGLSIGGIMVAQQANTSTNENLDEIQQALIDFVKTQGRLPCVAPLTVDPANTTTPIFGTELAAGGCLAATPASGGSLRAVDGTRIVRIGGVPTRTLGLKDRMASDEFGNRFLYVVTENLTTQAGFNTATNLGQIGVRDGGGSAGFILDSASANGGAAFMLISHGPDGKGAVRHKTNNVTNACGTSSNLDVENCDVTTTGTTAANLINFRDTRFNNGDLPASFFDDFTRFMPKYRLTALAGSSGSNLWGNNGDTIFSIGNDNNTTTGNVGIGTTTPVNRLTVAGDGTGIAQLGSACGGNYAGLTLGLTAAPTDCTKYNILSSPTDQTLYINRPTGAGIQFRMNNVDQMIITNTGNVGIGTTTPTARLDVAGETRVGNTNVACTAANEGSQRYNSSTKIMEFCNGSAWMPIGGAVTSGEIEGGTNQYVNHSITLSAPATVIFTGYGEASYTGGPFDAGNIMILRVNGSGCALDDSFEGQAYTRNFQVSATCIRRLNAGTYTLQSENQLYGAATRRFNRLHYVVIYH